MKTLTTILFIILCNTCFTQNKQDYKDVHNICIKAVNYESYCSNGLNWLDPERIIRSENISPVVSICENYYDGDTIIIAWTVIECDIHVFLWVDGINILDKKITYNGKNLRYNSDNL